MFFILSMDHYKNSHLRRKNTQKNTHVKKGYSLYFLDFTLQ